MLVRLIVAAAGKFADQQDDRKDEHDVEIAPALHEHRLHRGHEVLVEQRADHARNHGHPHAEHPAVADKVETFALARMAQQPEGRESQQDGHPLPEIQPLPENQDRPQQHEDRPGRLDGTGSRDGQVLETHETRNPGDGDDACLQENQQVVAGRAGSDVEGRSPQPLPAENGSQDEGRKNQGGKRCHIEQDVEHVVARGRLFLENVVDTQQNCGSDRCPKPHGYSSSSVLQYFLITP